MERGTLLACLLFRTLNALLVRTTFAPDEYWQSVEVAHRMVFGYGHLTWEWAAGLRGYLHPTLFAALYWVLKALGLDSTWLVAKGPMLLQAVFAAATDASVYTTTKLLWGRKSARWALTCQLLSWFNFYCSVRTYSNGLEALLTSLAAYHWLLCTWTAGRAAPAPGHPASKDGVCGQQTTFDAPAVSRSKRGVSRRRAQEGVTMEGTGVGHDAEQDQGRQQAASAAQQRYHQRCWLLLAALAAVLRPPCTLFWALLGLHQLATQRGGARLLLLLDAGSIGGCCLAVAALWDRVNYGRWVLVPWEFFKFNLVTGQSALYGSHPWHWNLTQGFPAITATLLPLMCAGVVGGRDARLAYLAGLSLALYSLPAHKEFRFLLPALHLAMPYCGPACSSLLSRWERAVTSRWGAAEGPKEGAAAAAVTKVGRRQGSLQLRPGWIGRKAFVAVVLVLAAVQVLMALHFSLMQHRGLLRVPGEVLREWGGSPNSTSVLFLTSCHATPWYSHLHAPVPMRFLDCSPPGWAPAVAAMNAAEMGWLNLPLPPTSFPPRSCPQPHGCLSQHQLFLHSPVAFLEEVFERNVAPPSMLVGYEEQLAGAQQLLWRHGYRTHRRLTNCWWQTDDDTPCSVTLWMRHT